MTILPFLVFSDAIENKHIKVGFYVQEPFVIEKEGVYSGLCVDLWKKIADSLGYTYVFKEYTEPEMLAALERNELDLGISPLTVTPSRIKRFEFSQPYYITNLAFASLNNKEHDFLEFLKAIFSINFFKALAPLAATVFIFGMLVWMVERRKNKAQFRRNHKGLLDGVWWSATTMTTVGYGDKAPVTPGGRALGMIWMFTAVIIISGLTASIASSLTVNKLNEGVSSFDDLRKVKVGSITGSGTADLLAQYDVDFIGYTSIDEGLIDVGTKRIKAFVYDEAILSYNLDQSKYRKEIKIIPSSYFKEYFSFASNNNKLIREIDVQLIDIIESTGWEGDLKKYGLEDGK